MFFTGAFLKELPFRQHPSLVFIGNNSFQENSCSEILSLKFFLISPTENPLRNGAITLFSEPPVRGIIGIGQTQNFLLNFLTKKQSTLARTSDQLTIWCHNPNPPGRQSSQLVTVQKSVTRSRIKNPTLTKTTKQVKCAVTKMF